ncbi:uncharacterized protein STEHIDRAFT_130987 [Stereum hirsutum FP-91666 SS1]|uniref:uncharacterized protein n=1 Tax=Stereum hirsutum (strain FP-91666) TaxID=721885 RepID=UPI000440F7FC|nr:uncharacterized protein STEHIDRAFT_130987 [Stereum hirsutum FP-91666 SS1]EIM87671.1 hypothetical protein STEHIDRAFT_130987 [Stereum hirsutum FP-91666 SS1]
MVPPDSGTVAPNVRKSTRRGVEEHPGLPDAPRAKRTSEQKRADEAKEAAAKHASEQAQLAAAKTKVNQLAFLEDRARQKERDDERIELRPDLVPVPTQSSKGTKGRTKTPKAPAMANSAKEVVVRKIARERVVNGGDNFRNAVHAGEYMDFDVPVGSDAPGPATSDVDELEDDEAEDDDEYELSKEQQGAEDEEEGNDDDDYQHADEDEDQDQDDEEDEDSDEEDVALAQRKKKKLQRGELRSEVLAARHLASARPSNAAASLKRKYMEGSLENPEPAKRPNKSEGGFRADWTRGKSAHKRKQANSGTHTPAAPSVSVKPTALQDITQSKPTQTPATDQSKPSGDVVKQQGRALPAVKVGRSRQVQVSRVPKLNDDGSTRTKKGKQRWTQAHLPFPGGQPGATCMRVWRNQFQCTLIHWAGSKGDPFGTNSLVGEAVDKIWPVLYSQLPLDEEGKRAVVGNSQVILNLWRNRLGKLALNVLWDIWAEMGIDDVSEESRDKRVEYVKEQLKNNRFVYRDLDNEENRGTFCSRFVLSIFALHLKNIEDASEDDALNFGDTHGALGLSAAAAERALRVCRSGINPFKDLTKAELKALLKADPSVTEFKSNPWGPWAEDYATSAKNLPDKRWDEIYDGAAEVECVIEDADGSDDDGEDSRAALLF